MAIECGRGEDLMMGCSVGPSAPRASGAVKGVGAPKIKRNLKGKTKIAGQSGATYTLHIVGTRPATRGGAEFLKVVTRVPRRSVGTSVVYKDGTAVFIPGAARSVADTAVIDRLPRDEMLEIVDSTLRKRLLEALDQSRTDWRTVASLADELGVSKAQVQQELSMLEPQIVRRPRGQESKYPDWYRLTARGLTASEKLLRLKAIVTFSILDDDF